MLNTGRCTTVHCRGVIGSVEEPGCATLHSSRSGDRHQNCLFCTAQDVEMSQTRYGGYAGLVPRRNRGNAERVTCQTQEW
jgi:hypothetical protein